VVREIETELNAAAPPASTASASVPELRGRSRVTSVSGVPVGGLRPVAYVAKPTLMPHLMNA